MSDFDEALLDVMTGLTNGSIPAVTSTIICHNSAKSLQPEKSKLRWACVHHIGATRYSLYVSENGDMGEQVRHFGGPDVHVRLFLPVDCETNTEALRRILEYSI